MRYLIILLCLAVLAIGLAGGFYLAVALQNNAQVLAGVAVAFVFLTWLGSGADFLGFLRDWYRQQNEEATIPTLGFMGLHKNNQSIYYLRVQRIKGSGKAEACEGYLFVDDVGISNLPTVWSHENAHYYDIGGYMDLRLFKIEEEHNEYATLKMVKSLMFSLANLEKGFTAVRRPFTNVVDKTLTVKIYAKRGKVPDPYQMKISEILEAAVLDIGLDEPIVGTYR